MEITSQLGEISSIFSFVSGESEESETEVGESDGYEDEVDFEARRRGGFSDEQVVDNNDIDIFDDISEIEFHFGGENC